MFKTRRLFECDIALVEKLARVAFAATYSKILTTAQIEYMLDMMYSPISLRTQFAEGHQYFAGELNGEPCAYISIQMQSSKLFHLQKIYVLPQFQKYGIGAKMFAKAVENVRERAELPALMELNVNRQNPAVNFYKRMGMSIVSSGDFPIGGGFFMNDYIMRLSLK